MKIGIEEANETESVMKEVHSVNKMKYAIMKIKLSYSRTFFLSVYCSTSLKQFVLMSLSFLHVCLPGKFIRSCSNYVVVLANILQRFRSSLTRALQFFFGRPQAFFSAFPSELMMIWGVGITHPKDMTVFMFIQLGNWEQKKKKQKAIVHIGYVYWK